MFRLAPILIRLIVAGTALSTASYAFAQVQGLRVFENRLEGTNVHTNALQDFTIIAVHRNFQPFAANASLHVRFFIPRTNNSRDKEVFLEAVERQDSFHYFMQAKNSKWKEDSWNVFEPWPTKDVIDRLGVQARNIAVLAGYRIGDGPRVYLPVDVYQTEAPSRANYTLHFITASELQSIDVSVTNAAGAALKAPRLQEGCNRAFNASCRLYAAGSAQALALDMTALPAGEYHVKFLGHVPGDLTPRTLDIIVYHHP